MLRPTELSLAEMHVAAAKRSKGGKNAKVRGSFVLWLLARHRKLEEIERIADANEIYEYGKPLNKGQIKWILDQKEDTFL